MARLPARLPRTVSPYPWGALERLSREVTTAIPGFRAALRQAIDEKAFVAALGEIVGAPIEIATTSIEILTGPDLPSLQGAAFVLSTSDGASRIGVEADRDLAALLVAKVTARPRRLMDPTRPVEASLTGAVAAIVAMAARRASGSRSALLPLGAGGLRVNAGERVMRVHLKVAALDETFSAAVTLPWMRPHCASHAKDARAELVRLDSLPLTLPVVAAAALASPSEISAMNPGDAWLPGAGWTIRHEASTLVGDVMLAAPASERVLVGSLRPDGGIVLGEGRAISLEAQAMQELEDDADTTTAADAVLDAPVLVRVEVGSVTLTAREWAALAPGDVIAVGKRLAEPVVLRVAGLEVARGELVDIEGELGVRIRERRGER